MLRLKKIRKKKWKFRPKSQNNKTNIQILRKTMKNQNKAMIIPISKVSGVSLITDHLKLNKT